MVFVTKEVWFFQFSELGGLRWPRGRLVAECDEKDEHGTEVDEEESRQVKELNGVCTVFNFCLWKKVMLVMWVDDAH